MADETQLNPSFDYNGHTITILAPSYVFQVTGPEFDEKHPREAQFNSASEAKTAINVAIEDSLKTSGLPPINVSVVTEEGTLVLIKSINRKDGRLAGVDRNIKYVYPATDILKEKVRRIRALRTRLRELEAQVEPFKITNDRAGFGSSNLSFALAKSYSERFVKEHAEKLDLANKTEIDPDAELLKDIKP